MPRRTLLDGERYAGLLSLDEITASSFGKTRESEPHYRFHPDNFAKVILCRIHQAR